ncbi:MAG: hypothetical protein ACKO0Y_04430, partial [Bacteroidota bacterium]
FSYIDRTTIQSLAEILTKLRKEEYSQESLTEQYTDISIKAEYTVTATIIGVKEKKFGGGKRSMLIVTVRDESNVQADCLFFNMVPYFKNILLVGSLLSISGIPDYDSKWRKLSFHHPDILVLDEEEQEEYKQGRILPKYRLSQSMKQAHISMKIMRNIINVIADELKEHITETLPDSIKSTYQFPNKHNAI